MITNPVTPSLAKSGQIEACVTSPSVWRSPIAAAALALVLGFASSDALALALGRMNVLSGIGEPLRAEIDVPQISPEEAATLSTAIARPEAFKAAGLEYNTALANAQITLQRRANGTAFLRVISDRVINEPFVDLILEASWNSGRIVRDYTMLFDPVSMRAQAAPAATTAAASPAPAPTAAPPAIAAAAPTPSATAAARPARTESAAKPVVKPVVKPVEKSVPKEGVSVKPGDTAAALAARYKPSGVSLDQMLVAMLGNSPDAFIGGNVNRLKAGAVIDMQAASSAAPATAEGQAKQTIVAQAKDFNEFRRRLASGAPTAVAAAPSRAAGGKVQANVSEPKAQATAPDKLTLSKAGVAAKAKEDQIAKDKQSKANETRVAELSKNIQDLNKLGGTTAAKPAAAASATGQAAAASAPGVKVTAAAPTLPAAASPTVASVPAAAPKPSTTAALSTPSTALASATAIASSTSSSTATASLGTTSTVQATPSAPVQATAAAVVAAAPKPAPPAPAPLPEEPSFVDGLLDNPVLLPAAGGLLAGLGGLAFWRIRQKKKAAQVDSSFLESRLQPDSFFGASGGQRVDTADSGGSAAAGSSMVYSPSQLDAAGDVDPVAEADVYLAYGRDLQAEEILKEALRSNSSRVAIHVKLMEIYAKRRDTQAFEAVAKEAFQLTQGQGLEWATASALGRDLDPANPLYAQGNSASGAGLAGSVMLGGAATAAAAYSPNSTVPMNLPQEAADSEIDFDLDFSASENFSDASAQATVAFNAPTVAMQAVQELDPIVDFDMSEPAALSAVKLSAPDFDLLNNSLEFSNDLNFASSAPTAPMALKVAPSEPSSLEFDLGGLTLDLPGATAASNAVDAGVSGDPLETKLALAAEFRDIGDSDGARSLVQEVVDEASGPMKARAMKMLADLG